MDNFTGLENQYVIFKLDNESYALDISLVKTIEKVSDFTRIPNSEDYIKGVINLRGEVIPVIDLRKRFNLDEVHENDNSRVIITSTDDTVIGLLVDSSSEVMFLESNEIDNPPKMNDNNDYYYIKGIGKKENKLILIVDLNKILDLEGEE